MIELTENGQIENAPIRVVGVGGCGGNAVNNMIEQGLKGVSFITANTDKQALDQNLAKTKIQIGKEITKGLGAGGDPEIGMKSAEESVEEIRENLEGSDMVFVTAGMGGGTGTGAAPVIAKIAMELEALVVGIVTYPFKWEGKRLKLAEEGIKNLRESVDALISIPNQKLLEIIDKRATFQEAFLKADEVLLNATKGISDIITQPGLVNVDFADVRSVMKGMGDALMGIGIASGENRAVEAAEKALKSPLLDNISIQGSKGALVNITGSKENFTLHEMSDILAMIEEAAGSDVNLYHGVVLKDEPMEELMITVVATGFNDSLEKNHKCAEPVKNYQVEEKELFGDKNGTSKKAEENDEENEKAPAADSPKGTKELKGLDIPAFIRRIGDTITEENPQAGNTTPGIPEKALSEMGDERSKVLKNLEQPAFIRRMMD